MGLIRKAIVLGGIVLAMPSPPALEAAGEHAPSAFAAISAAAETYSDLKTFCQRRPQACTTGQYLAASLQSKLRYTTKLAYEWANGAEKPAHGQQKVKAPELRLATLTEEKPKSIEDLLKGTLDETPGN